MKGKVSRGPILLEGTEVKIDFIIIPNGFFDIVIGRLTLNRFDGVLDFKTKMFGLIVVVVKP